jgi:hypothetical protein
MYRGQVVDIQGGRGGLNGNINSYLIPPTDLLVARNLRFDGFVWRKAGGLSLFDSVAVATAPTCYGGWDWRPNSGNQNQVTFWSNGNVYKETGADIDAVLLGTLSAPANPVVFCEGGSVSAGLDKELYIFNKGNSPKKLTGTGVTLAAFTNESADWSSNKPGAGIQHDFRTVAFDVDSAPHNLYFSALADLSDFVGSGGDTGYVFSVAPGVGDRIIAANSYLPQQLYVFKYPRGIWAVDTTDFTGDFLPTTLVRDDVGAAGPNCIAKVGNDLWFISGNGRLYSVQALRPDTDPLDADITAKLNLKTFIEENVDATKLKFARLIYDEARREIWYVYSSQAGTGINDSVLIIDLNEPGVLKTAVDDRGEYFQAVWKRVASTGFNEILVAGVGGLVYRANAISRSIGGTTAYTSELKTIDTDFRFVDPVIGSREKRYDFLEISILPTGNYTLGIDVYIDGMFKKSINISAGDSSAAFDSATFDTSTFAGQLIIKHKVPLDLVGNIISLRLINSDLNADFAIINLRIHYVPQNVNYEA